MRDISYLVITTNLLSICCQLVCRHDIRQVLVRPAAKEGKKRWERGDGESKCWGRVGGRNLG